MLKLNKTINILVHIGKDWSDGNKDGGVGNIGVVIQDRSNGIVIVRLLD